MKRKAKSSLSAN